MRRGDRPRVRSCVTTALAATLVVAALGVSACSKASSDETSSRLLVVATTTQLADFARVVGGDAVTVYPVLRANVDPHDYEPSPADLDAIARAGVIVENGIGLEKWFESTIRSAEPSGTVVVASAGVSVRRNTASGEPSGDDPHIWHDPRNAIVMVTNLERALSAAAPAQRVGFEQRRAAYVAHLQAVDADIAARIAALPDKHLVTNHDAFGYYVDRYGLDYVGSIIPSFDSSAELSARDLSDLVSRIRSSGARAVFSENSLPAKTAATIGAEAGVKVVAGDGALYGDTLGPAGSDGDTYLKMLAHNTRVIVENLR